MRAVREILAAWRKPGGPVVGPGEFVIAAVGLQHGHIYEQCQGLVRAGATLKWAWDREPARVAEFLRAFPQARAARALDEILEDSEVRLVAGAAITSERGPIGCRVMRAGKDYFTDKGPFTTLDQLAEARRVAAETGRKYLTYYGERLNCECAIFAGELVRRGVIGRVAQVLGLGPHRLGPSERRPAWFFRKAEYGGILCDIGSHQFDAFLHFTGARDARIAHARVENLFHPQFPELEDFGEATLVGDNGASLYCRVDWLTPAGLRSFGDGRTILVGEKGYIELRKYADIGTERRGNQLYLVTDEGEFHYNLQDRIGEPFYGELIRDCLERTENAMTQWHAFKAAELCLQAQAIADAARRASSASADVRPSPPPVSPSP